MKNSLGDPFKLSVFVGSPKREMGKVRQAIIQAVLGAGHIPDGMELWAADANPTLKTIAEKLQLCDVHVVILGSNYGSRVGNDEISFTEWEYRQSRDASRPVIAFLLEKEVYEQAWLKSPPGGGQAEMDSYRKLWSELSSNSVCKLYPSTTMASIDRDVMNALNHVMDSGQLRPLAGWVRAESKAAKLAGALQGNPFLLRVMDRVVRFRTTGGRFETERIAKKAAAEMFWDAMMNRLARSQCLGLFLESGSSLAYVSEALESRLERHQGWKIATNNALTLLQLMLFTDGEVRRNPPVAPDPDDPYGAIFTHKCKQAYEEPQAKPRALYPKELQAIDEIIALLKAGAEKQIILATASGWDTAHPVLEFRGPHVGSHANMLFKRAIFMTGEPVVLFLSRHKVDSKFREARFKSRTDSEPPDGAMRYCYPVFGEELPLATALVETPLALCIGYELEKDDEARDIREVGQRLKALLRPELEPAGFDMEYAAKEFKREDGIQSGAFIVANEKFRLQFPR